MPRILLVADRIDAFEELARSLDRENDMEIFWAHDGDAAVDMAAAESPQLVIVDETIGETSGLEVIRRLISANAFIQTATVSRLDPEAFHEASEGLGIMAQLPPRPTQADARQLLRTLGQYG